MEKEGEGLSMETQEISLPRDKMTGSGTDEAVARSNRLDKERRVRIPDFATILIKKCLVVSPSARLRVAALVDLVVDIVSRLSRLSTFSKTLPVVLREEIVCANTSNTLNVYADRADSLSDLSPFTNELAHRDHGRFSTCFFNVAPRQAGGGADYGLGIEAFPVEFCLPQDQIQYATPLRCRREEDRELFRHASKNGFVDVLDTVCCAQDHDLLRLARCLGRSETVPVCHEPMPRTSCQVAGRYVHAASGSSRRGWTYSALTMPLASCSPLLRVPSTASISSIKTMLGCNFLAREKTAFTILLESPYHFSVKVEMCKLMKQAPLSCASALASIVLPQPGGPYRRTPDGAESKEELYEYRCGSVSG